MAENELVERLANRLDMAWRTRTPIAPLTESGVNDSATAYAIQAHWTAMRVERGDKIVGRKIGLTSKAIQEQLKVSEPDYGTLWRSSFYKARGGEARVPAADFLQPRVEGEIAFKIGKRLEGGKVTPADVLASTEACALGVEIVDSRIADWKIKLADTIADNASYGGFSLGPWDTAMARADLKTLQMNIVKNGEHTAEGVGAAALGDPAVSTAWLVNKLAEFGVALEPGDVVISGGITKMLPARAGDVFVFSLTSQPDLTVRFV